MQEREIRKTEISSSPDRQEAEVSIRGNGYYYLLAMAGNEPYSALEIAVEANNLSRQSVHFYTSEVLAGMNRLLEKGFVRVSESTQPKTFQGGWNRRVPSRKFFELTEDGLTALSNETIALHALAVEGIDHGLLKTDIEDLEPGIPSAIRSAALGYRPQNAIMTTSHNQYHVLMAVNLQPRTYDEIINQIRSFQGEKKLKDMKPYEKVIRRMVREGMLAYQDERYAITELGKWHGFVDTDHLLLLVDEAIAREVVEPVLQEDQASEENTLLTIAGGDEEPFEELRKYKTEVTEIAEQLENVFRQEATRLGIALLPTVHRVGNMQGDMYAAVLRPEDVLFVERSQNGRELSEVQLHEAFSAIQQLATIFYPFAEQYAKITFRHYGDDAIVAAKGLVDRIVWKTWLPGNTAPEMMPESLRRLVLASLPYTWRYVVEEKKREEPLYSPSPRDEKDILHTGVTTQLVYDKVPTGPRKNPNVRTMLRDYVRQSLQTHSFAEIFAHIELLSPRSQLVLLQLMGWFDDQWSVQEFYEHTLPTGAYDGDLKRAASELIGILATRQESLIAPQKTLATITSQAENHIVFKINNTTLIPTARRRVIAEGMVTATEEDLQTMSNIRQQVFQLASAHTYGVLTYTIDDIAEKLGLSENGVQQEIAALAKQFGYKRRGESIPSPIAARARQERLRLVWNTVSEDKLNKLDEHERHLFEQYTSEGYPAEDIDSIVIRRIYRKLAM